MKHRDKILQLRSEGKSYNEIQKILGCSKGTISYHCSNDGVIISRKKKHILYDKCYRFINRKDQQDKKERLNRNTNKELLYHKIRKFHLIHPYTKKRKHEKMSFTPEDIIAKFGENPKCYLTGEEIDLYKPRTYHFDHKIPRAKGGPNTLDNLGICTKIANNCKHDLTEQELLNLCQKILSNKGYIIQKSGMQDSNLQLPESKSGSPPLT